MSVRQAVGAAGREYRRTHGSGRTSGPSPVGRHRPSLHPAPIGPRRRRPTSRGPGGNPGAAREPGSWNWWWRREARNDGRSESALFARRRVRKGHPGPTSGRYRGSARWTTRGRLATEGCPANSRRDRTARRGMRHRGPLAFPSRCAFAARSGERCPLDRPAAAPCATDQLRPARVSNMTTKPRCSPSPPIATAMAWEVRTLPGDT